MKLIPPQGGRDGLSAGPSLHKRSPSHLTYFN